MIQWFKIFNFKFLFSFNNFFNHFEQKLLSLSCQYKNLTLRIPFLHQWEHQPSYKKSIHIKSVLHQFKQFLTLYGIKDTNKNQAFTINITAATKNQSFKHTQKIIAKKVLQEGFN